MKPIVIPAIVLVLASLLGVSSVPALEPHHRTGWYLGLGFGPARGAIWEGNGSDGSLWDTGSSPQIRLGKVLGQHAAIGLEAQTWFIEGGTIGDDQPIQVKLRFTGHLWALAGTWFPGRPDSFWGGLFARAGAGPAIANYAAAIPDISEPETGQEIQYRIDEWGWGAMAAVGYEFRVSRSFATGVQLSSNYLWIHEGIDRMWFGAPVLLFNWYF